MGLTSVGRRHRLKALQLTAELKPGRYADGDGLYLRVSPTLSRSWMFMWTKHGKRYEMGLGRTLDVSLKEARMKAEEVRGILQSGGNPFSDMEERKERLDVKTFGMVADDFIAAMRPSWSNPKHAAQWEMTLGHNYCAQLRKIPVQDVQTENVLAIITPIWKIKAETASRIRGRIEKVLDFAKTKGWRTGDNPARWTGHLQNALPARKKADVKHFEAMAYEDLPAFVARLQPLEATAARALEFLILTAARTGEAIGAVWSEIDLKTAVWTIPAERMKNREEHRVPLSPAALAILMPLHETRISEFVFPGQKSNRPLSNMAMDMLLRRMGIEATVHGFRSSFRDWCGDATSFPRDLAEAALSHTVRDKTEAAYRRGDALEKRRKMMLAWANYCLKPLDGKVLTFRQSP